MKAVVATGLMLMASACSSLFHRTDLRDGDAFQHHTAHEVAQAVVWLDGHPAFAVTNSSTVAALWTASQHADFVANAFVDMWGSFASIVYHDSHDRLLAICTQQASCYQVTQHTRIKGEEARLVGASPEHARLIYNLVAENAPEYLRGLRQRCEKKHITLEALLFDCDDGTLGRTTAPTVRRTRVTAPAEQAPRRRPAAGEA